MSELLRADGVGFAYRKGADALREVDLTVTAGRHLGIVGESGAGKSTLLRLLLGLDAPTAGRLFADGTPLDVRDRARLRAHRRFVQPVFQDPYSSLDPRRRIGAIVSEPLRSLGIAHGETAATRAAHALKAVGLPADVVVRFPHQFSGGQRQRIAIARAIVGGPQVLLADEPVSALDMSTRVQVIDLLDELGQSGGLEGRPLTVVLVSHDLSVVARLCHDIVVLERGTVVERGTTREVLTAPREPYTQRLLASVPRLSPQS
ncbi:ABC transporter ATP-binding protein [Gryllotalpicola reticulitermitis]|uniref:ABC transporter ATP-binding protein n=1 Tax=Gryllotalpicola reticulitermitis TaxID=1184153 RepID=A0ABV8Q5G1_9MICO